jgi:hypothetical protein
VKCNSSLWRTKRCVTEDVADACVWVMVIGRRRRRDRDVESCFFAKGLHYTRTLVLHTIAAAAVCASFYSDRLSKQFYTPYPSAVMPC